MMDTKPTPPARQCLTVLQGKPVGYLLAQAQTRMARALADGDKLAAEKHRRVYLAVYPLFAGQLEKHHE
jgi:hypothetical protein